MTYEQIQRVQQARRTEQVDHVVVWSGELERKGLVPSLLGARLSAAVAVEQGRQARKGAGVSR